MTQDWSDWSSQFQAFCRQGSVDGMVQSLQIRATSHAGTANSSVKNQAIKWLIKIWQDQWTTLYQLALGLCRTADPTAQEVGVIVLAEFYQDHPDEVDSVLRRLADSENWEVREWVASACGLILEKHFPGYFPVVKAWFADDSENVRRAAILGIMYAGKSRNPDYAEPFLDALAPLLADRSRYVRDNLGPFALGNALIKYYPAQLLRRMDEWIRDEDEQVRWNLAMIFTAAEGAKFARQAQPVIDILLSDERPMVKKAVTKAVKNIAKRSGPPGERPFVQP